MKYVEDMKTLKGGGCSKRVADKRTSTWKRRIAAAALAAAIAVTPAPALANPVTDFLTDTGNAVMSFFGLGEPVPTSTEGTSNHVADASSMNDWKEVLSETGGEYITRNIGRVWTDKTVSENDIALEASASGNAPEIDKGDSDFLVALSALSSASNITTTSSVPLDIVLVLDVSGSMNNDLTTVTTEYEAVYNVEENGRGPQYYAKVEDDYVEIQRVWWENWDVGFDRWDLDGQTVEPKTSESDNTSGHIQFYTRTETTRTTTKIDALKTAANGFIEATAALNDEIDDAGSQHRISVVKYADNSYNNAYGNNLNDEGYNFTQRLNQLTAYKTNTVSSLTDMVNKLVPAGATSADFGLTMAEKEFTEHSREGVQKVVIFFTDGEPNHFNGFDGTVANDAIKKAKTLKTGTAENPGALIYSIGVFANANPNDTTGNFNAYMHGVSSNYPNAESYSSLGARADNSDYYKAATDAAELEQIFQDIQEEINSGLQSPTHVPSGDPLLDAHNSGYITITDTLGEYTQVDDFKSIVYADVKYENPEKDGPKSTGNPGEN